MADDRPVVIAAFNDKIFIELAGVGMDHNHSITLAKMSRLASADIEGAAFSAAGLGSVAV